MLRASSIQIMHSKSSALVKDTAIGNKLIKKAAFAYSNWHSSRPSHFIYTNFLAFFFCVGILFLAIEIGTNPFAWRHIDLIALRDVGLMESNDLLKVI